MQTKSNPPVLAPVFEGVLMLHDDIMPAVAAISGARLLDPQTAETILVKSQRHDYLQLKAADGKPYRDAPLNGVLKRYYLFADPYEPQDAARMIALVCTVARDVKTGVIAVMPEHLYRGPEADFVMSVRFGCCASQGRTMIYSDRSNLRGVFMNIGSSGGQVRAEIRQIWKNMKATVLGPQGLAALAHLADDMTGRCGGHAHAGRADYTRAASWAGRSLAPA